MRFNNEIIKLLRQNLVSTDFRKERLFLHLIANVYALWAIRTNKTSDMMNLSNLLLKMAYEIKENCIIRTKVEGIVDLVRAHIQANEYYFNGFSTGDISLDCPFGVEGIIPTEVLELECNFKNELNLLKLELNKFLIGEQ